MIIFHDNYNMEIEHKIINCEECKRLMKLEGRACKKFYDECVRDEIYINNLMEMEDEV